MTRLADFIDPAFSLPRGPRMLETYDDLDDARVGDVIVSLGQRHLITRIEPYDPAKVGHAGEQWCIAYEDRQGHANPWGITICNDKPLRAAKGVTP